MSDPRSDPDRILDDENCEANCQFKRSWLPSVSLAVILSVGLHIGVLEAFPQMGTEKMSSEDGSSTEVVDMPPSTEVPSPPDRVARPSEPEVATAPVTPEATIAPTDFTEEKRRPETPTPPAVNSSAGDRPSFIPRDVDPKLQNESRLRELLKQKYPPALAEAGIGGTVVLWVFVDTEGEVVKSEVRQSSGYDKLDAAALDIAEEMAFEPARNRDKPVGVWVAHRITFSPAVVD